MEMFTHLVPSPVTLPNLLALASFGVVWLPESERVCLDRHLDLKNKPLDFVARVGFGDPNRAKSISLFHLERLDTNENGKLCEKIVPLGSYADFKRALSDLQEARVQRRENLRRREDTLSDSVKAAFPENYAESGRRILSTDFEGKSPFHFLVQAKSREEWRVLWRNPGESRVRDSSFSIGPGLGAWSLEEAPRKIRKFLMQQVVWPHVRDLVRRNDSLLTTDSDTAVCQRHFFPDENFAVDRIIFRPNFDNATIEAFTLNPETCEPTKTVISNGDLPRFEEMAEGFCAQQFANYFCALENLKARVGDKFIETSGSRLSVSDGDYRVCVDAQKLRVEVIYKLPGMDTRTKSVRGLNPVAVDCLVQEVLAEQEKGKAFVDAMASLRDTSLGSPRRSVCSADFRGKALDHVFVRPDESHSVFEISYLKPGDSSVFSENVSRAGDLAAAVERVRAPWASALADLEALKARLGDKWVEAGSSSPFIGPEDYVVRIDQRQRRAEVHYGLSGIGIGKATARHLTASAIEEAIAKAQEAQRRGKAFDEVVQGLSDAVQVRPGKDVKSKHFSGKPPGYVILCPASDFSDFTIYDLRPGDSSITSSSVSRVEEIAEKVRELREAQEAFLRTQEEIKAFLGDKFFDGSSRIRTLDDGDYRVRVRQKYPQLKIYYKVPGVDTLRKKRRTDSSLAAVEAFVREAKEEQERAKAFLDLISTVPNASPFFSKWHGDEVLQGKPYGYVNVRPHPDYSAFTIFYVNPGESSSRSTTVSRLQDIPEKVREIRKPHETFIRSFEEAKAFLGDKFLERSSSLPCLEDGDYRIRLSKRHLQAKIFYKVPFLNRLRRKRGSDVSLATVKNLVQKAREEQERAKAFQDLAAGIEGASGISPGTWNIQEKLGREPDGHVYICPNDEFTSFTLLWLAPGGFEDVATTSVSLAGIVEGVKKAKQEMSCEDRLQLNMMGLRKTGTASAFAIPPAAAGVEYRHLLDLRKELYNHTGKRGIDFRRSDVDNLEDALRNFVDQVNLNGKFSSMRKGYQRELAEKVRTLVRLVISGLKKKNDPSLTYSVLKAFAEASHQCGGRYLAAATHEYMNVHDCWDKQFTGQWDERMRSWIDELKVGIATEMVRRLDRGHNMHTRNYFLHSLDRNGIKIPPAPDIDFDDPYLTYETAGYGPERVVRRFKWDFSGAVVEAIRDKANDAMVKDNAFCQQVLDGLHEYVEKYLTTPEDEKKIAEAKKKGAGKAFASAKQGVLQNRIFEAELVEWTDDTFTHIRLTREGTKALLHELEVITLPVRSPRHS